MLYDREDRMSRPIFLTEYDIEGSTEKRAMAEGLPWPPYVVMGGRVYYSRRLVARWFEQQAGVHQAQPVEMADGDEFWQAGKRPRSGACLARPASTVTRPTRRRPRPRQPATRLSSPCTRR